jgi:hypothetical protein
VITVNRKEGANFKTRFDTLSATLERVSIFRGKGGGGAEIEIFGNLEKKFLISITLKHLKFGRGVQISLGGVGTLSVGGGEENILRYGLR